MKTTFIKGFVMLDVCDGAKAGDIVDVDLAEKPARQGRRGRKACTRSYEVLAILAGLGLMVCRFAKDRCGCGAAKVKGAAFCPACGRSLAEPTQPSATTEAPAASTARVIAVTGGPSAEDLFRAGGKVPGAKRCGKCGQLGHTSATCDGLDAAKRSALHVAALKRGNALLAASRGEAAQAVNEGRVIAKRPRPLSQPGVVVSPADAPPVPAPAPTPDVATIVAAVMAAMKVAS